jgi:Holliday junction resolvase RusA-like endonuclease
MGTYKRPPKSARAYSKWLMIHRYNTYKQALAASMAHLEFDRGPKSREAALFVQVFAWFGDRTHGDPDNVLKGVLDALFASDKHIVSQVDYGYDPTHPRVVIRITEARTGIPAWALPEGAGG